MAQILFIHGCPLPLSLSPICNHVFLVVSAFDALLGAETSEASNVSSDVGRAERCERVCAWLTETWSCTPCSRHSGSPCTCTTHHTYSPSCHTQSVPSPPWPRTCSGRYSWDRTCTRTRRCIRGRFLVRQTSSILILMACS